MSVNSAGKMTVYPANRLEDLALLLAAVLKLRPGSVLEPNVVIVESKGIQHWLSMELARRDRVCMNTIFPMPGNFIWQIVRRVLSFDRLPGHSCYQREALSWRIDHLLSQKLDLDDPVFGEVTRYWLTAKGCEDRLKRYQLASKLAGLFEQYMLFRYDWINGWESGKEMDNVQACLWRALVEEDPNHPIRLQKKTARHLARNRDRLPPQICLFAINTLPKSSLEFFNELAGYTQVHLFHLNPCVEYWGNIQSEKNLAAQQVRQLQSDQWLNFDEFGSGVGNPLLANLGTQGKEFFSSLQGLDAFEISAFETDTPKSEAVKPNVLQYIQQDILQLRDARVEPVQRIDDSLTFSASHSALRELQALHDWLLHQFDDDDNKSLTPRDILVMCPQVEDYAPYVGAVFDDGRGQSLDNTAPRLPCSITDRSPKDSEPLVSTFLELLSLPDSRFRISSILDLLRLPALQRKFGLAADELSTIEWWLSEACVHWGLDIEHKLRVSGQERASQMFSWEWGLRRLLLGFAQADHQEIVDGDLLLPHIEGDQAVLLGRLMQLIERLRRHAKELNRARSGAEWGEYLRTLKDAFFNRIEEDDDAEISLTEAIDQMVAWIGRVDYGHAIPLEVVRYYLSHQLGLPDGASRFMTGQITFCSLTPMRSTPFKIIAILGLNDGEYPRQSLSFGFDLMAQQPRRPGDRSRRGDDRYLFLEALISARDKLYLSYQGANIKNNAIRQPSLILTELMDYMKHGYGWSFDTQGKGRCQLRSQPLHPFSPDNFCGSSPSFDARWYALSVPGSDRNNLIKLEPQTPPVESLDIEALVGFLDNPVRSFAEKRLGLSLGVNEGAIDDSEPFDADSLQAYLEREQMLLAELKADPTCSIERVRQVAMLSGRLPDSALTVELLDEWEQEAIDIASRIDTAGGNRIRSESVTLQVGDVTLSATLPWVDGQDRLLLWRSGKKKPKDIVRLWLYHLCALAYTDSPVVTQGVFLLEQELQFPPVANPMAYLKAIVDACLRGQCAPLVMHAELGLALSKSQFRFPRNAAPVLKDDPAAERQKQWNLLWKRDDYTQTFAFSMEPYLRWFWPQAPELKNWWHELEAIYLPLTECLNSCQGGGR